MSLTITVDSLADTRPFSNTSSGGVKLNKFFSRLAISIFLLTAAAAAFAQNYPLPGSSTAAPVLCVGCPRTNPAGQNNEGLKTWPYSTPIKSFVGRYVDSVNTSDWTYFFRTARAAEIVVAPTQRGSAPPRIYIQVGSGIAAYSMSTFFTSRLPGGLTDIPGAFGIEQHPGLNEKALKPDAFIYPESGGSGWKVYTIHGQDTLFGIDYDDRGYVYAAYSLMGWGILVDDGRTSGGQLQKVAQVVDSLPEGCDSTNASSCSILRIPTFTTKAIAAVKAGTSYYALVYNPEQAGQVAIYNVTTPT